VAQKPFIHTIFIHSSNWSVLITPYVSVHILLFSTARKMRGGHHHGGRGAAVAIPPPPPPPRVGLARPTTKMLDEHPELALFHGLNESGVYLAEHSSFSTFGNLGASQKDRMKTFFAPQEEGRAACTILISANPKGYGPPFKLCGKEIAVGDGGSNMCRHVETIERPRLAISEGLAAASAFVSKIAKRPEEFLTRSDKLASSLRQHLKQFFDYGARRLSCISPPCLSPLAAISIICSCIAHSRWCCFTSVTRVVC
jgi:hypothetical protein